MDLLRCMRMVCMSVYSSIVLRIWSTGRMKDILLFLAEIVRMSQKGE